VSIENSRKSLKGIQQHILKRSILSMKLTSMGGNPAEGLSKKKLLKCKNLNAQSNGGETRFYKRQG